MTVLWRRTAAEFVGTAALVTTVFGSGIMAQTLSTDGAVQLLANSTATVFGLAVLIAVFGPISGAHFNPVVSLAETGGSAVTPALGSPLARLVSTSRRRLPARSLVRSSPT